MKTLFIIFLTIFTISYQQLDQFPNLVTFIPKSVIDSVIRKYQYKITDKLAEPINIQENWVTDYLKIYWIKTNMQVDPNLEFVKVTLSPEQQTLNVHTESFDFSVELRLKLKYNRIIKTPSFEVQCHGTILSNELYIKLKLGENSNPDVPKFEALEFINPIIKLDTVRFKVKNFKSLGLDKLLSRVINKNWFGAKDRIVNKINRILQKRLTQVINDFVFEKMYHALPREIIYSKESIGFSTKTMTEISPEIQQNGIIIPWEGNIYPLSNPNFSGEICKPTNFQEQITNQIQHENYNDDNQFVGVFGECFFNNIINTLAENNYKLNYKLPQNTITDVLQVHILKVNMDRSQIIFSEGKIDVSIPVKVTAMNGGESMGQEAKCLSAISIVLNKTFPDPKPEGSIVSYSAVLNINEIFDINVLTTGDIEYDPVILQEELKNRLSGANFVIGFDIPQICLFSEAAQQMCIVDIDILVKDGFFEQHVKFLS